MVDDFLALPAAGFLVLFPVRPRPIPARGAEQFGAVVPILGGDPHLEFQFARLVLGDGKEAELFTCPGHCDRKLRPLSCRIFPLVPYAKEGEELKIVMDIRGRGMCPLATAMKIEDLDPEFVKKVTLAMKLCMNVKQTREFIYALSESIDELSHLEEEFL